MVMEKPAFEVVAFDAEDVIVTSGCSMDCPDDCGWVCDNKCELV